MFLKWRNNQANVKQLSRRLSSRCSCFNPFSSSDTKAFICFMSIPWRFCRQKNTKNKSISWVIHFSYGKHLLTSYAVCRFLAFWLRNPKTLEKCSFRISLNTCEKYQFKQKFRFKPWEPGLFCSNISSTLSWEFSMTFTLLSDEVTSGPNSTHPAEHEAVMWHWHRENLTFYFFACSLPGVFSWLLFLSCLVYKNNKGLFLLFLFLSDECSNKIVLMQFKNIKHFQKALK